jgi:cell division protein FtsW (lipid II flippase)
MAMALPRADLAEVANSPFVNLLPLECAPEVPTAMPERQALAILGCALVLMALILVRPSSGMRIVVFALVLAVAALLGMSLGLRDLLNAIAGTS